jgi:hypothetical protein
VTAKLKRAIFITFVVSSFQLRSTVLRKAKTVLSRKSFYQVHFRVVGRAVAQLVEALRYKPERRGFDSQWCHWN